MGGMHSLLVQLLALAVAAGGAHASERPDGTRGCRARIEAGGGGIEVDRRRDLRVGPVVFFGLRKPRHQFVSATPRSDPAVKAAIAVRAGGPVLLRIPRAARRDLALNYAVERDGTPFNVRRVSDGQSLVRVTPCRPSTPRFSGGGRVGRWTAFSGGFVMRARGCFPVEVARAGKPFVRRRIAFGATCR
jgi:hypothetical protein